MNQLLVYRYIFIITLIAGSCLLYSCKDSEHYDVTGDTENRVYLPVGGYTVNAYNKYVFSVTHTPAGSIGRDISVATPVMCTHPASADLKVSFSVNKQLVDTYNAEKGTKYSKIPDGIVDFDNVELTIPQGQFESLDSLKISIPAAKYSQLSDSAYVLPLEITSLNGAGNAAGSSNRGVLYVVIKTVVTNSYNNAVANDMVGSLVSARASWTATTTITPSTGTTSMMFDARTNTYWTLSPSRMVSFTVDLNSTLQSIRGIRLNTSSTTYSLTSVSVSSSMDGNNWTSQGTATLSTSSSYQYVKFYSPVVARYIKVEIKGWRSATSLRLAEFDVYTLN